MKNPTNQNENNIIAVQNTTIQGKFNDTHTKLYEQSENIVLTYCCNATVPFPKQNETAHCPKCNRTIIPLICDVFM